MQIPKYDEVQSKVSHLIFRRMHRALNIDYKNN